MPQAGRTHTPELYGDGTMTMTPPTASGSVNGSGMHNVEDDGVQCSGFVCHSGQKETHRKKVTIAAHPVMARMWSDDVYLRSCLKKSSDLLPRTSRRLRFSPQTEVRYYLNRPLVAESGLQRIVSTVKGKLFGQTGDEINASKSRSIVPAQFSSRGFGKGAIYVLGNS